MTRCIFSSLLLLVLLACGCVHAHTYLSSVTIAGQQQTGCVRPVASNSPVMPLTTNPSMECGLGTQATQPASKKCPVQAGAKVGLQYYHNSPSPSDDIIDASHRGPCIVYLSNDNGNTWFKVYENGYNNITQQFCVDTLRANKGYLEFTLPSAISNGNYMMRTEIIALHEAYPGGNGAQPYVSCTELTISNGGSVKPPPGVVFPGAYKMSDPGITFNLYAPFTQYIIPGPPLFQSASSSATSSDTSSGSEAGGSGMSAGASAALAIVLIAAVVAIAASVFFYKKNGHLFGHSLKSTRSKQYLGTGSRKGSSYVEFNEADQL